MNGQFGTPRRMQPQAACLFAVFILLNVWAVEWITDQTPRNILLFGPAHWLRATLSATAVVACVVYYWRHSLQKHRDVADSWTEWLPAVWPHYLRGTVTVAAILFANTGLSHVAQFACREPVSLTLPAHGVRWKDPHAFLLRDAGINYNERARTSESRPFLLVGEPDHPKALMLSKVTDLPAALAAQPTYGHDDERVTSTLESLFGPTVRLSGRKCILGFVVDRAHFKDGATLPR